MNVNFLGQNFLCPNYFFFKFFLDPTLFQLFSIFINDLAIEIKESNIGINLNANGGPNLDYIFNI